MLIRVDPGSALHGEVEVPGDKSIAHRWLILASTAKGRSRLAGLPGSLDVRSTASCLARVAPKARPSLEVWARNVSSGVEGGGSTWNAAGADPALHVLEVEGEGRDGLMQPAGDLDCGNSGTSMRLLAGVLAAAPFRSVLTGDASLSSRPMERVAEPLRLMGAQVETLNGHAPLVVEGGELRGIRYASPVPSAQVKSAVLLAGLAAEGETTVQEPVATRDHTERALKALGVEVTTDGPSVTVRRSSYGGFEATVPGDPSSAAFLVAAAALTGSELTISGVCLNPTRLHFLDVMARMGIQVETAPEAEQMGEPVGSLHVHPCAGIRPVRVEPDELPLVIDEIPILAALSAHAPGDSWFLGAGELRIKESDRLAAVATSLRALGGSAADEGDDLVIAGGGLPGGAATSGGDHRMAMALTVAALAAASPCHIEGVEAADVSFPGFLGTMKRLGAGIEVLA